jgi:hypothetical protein
LTVAWMEEGPDLLAAQWARTSVLNRIGAGTGSQRSMSGRRVV